MVKPQINFFKQICAITAYLDLVFFGYFFPYLITCYFLFFTSYRVYVLGYLIWIYTFDKQTPERGGRRIEWVRNWICWAYIRDYFPITLVKSEDTKLDSTQNYLFACFPHGLFPTGPMFSLATNCIGYKKLFPYHKPHFLLLAGQFLSPFHREVMLALGACSVSEKSMNWILGNQRGGNVAAVMVGGMQEALFCKPGKYKLCIKSRKGFVRLALKNGSPLVPVFSFGETDLYDQVSNADGSRLRRFQEWLKSKICITVPIPKGRGFIQPSLIPRQKPVVTFGE